MVILALLAFSHQTTSPAVLVLAINGSTALASNALSFAIYPLALFVLAMQ